MPLLARHHCTRCKESVFNCVIDGKRVPLVLYFVTGQPDDTGGPLDINGEGVKLPSFVRELQHTPVPRIELCMKCVAEVFNVPLVTAAADPLYDANNDKIPDALQLTDAAISKTEMLHRMHTRALHAIAVGQGRAAVKDLAPEYLPPQPLLPVETRGADAQ